MANGSFYGSTINVVEKYFFTTEVTKIFIFNAVENTEFTKLDVIQLCELIKDPANTAEKKLCVLCGFFLLLPTGFRVDPFLSLFG